MKRWSEKEIEFLKDNMNSMSNIELAEALHVENVKTIQWALHRYHLKRAKKSHKIAGKQGNLLNESHKSNNSKSYISGNTKSKYTTFKGKQLQTININLKKNPDLLKGIELCIKGVNRNIFYSNDERLRYIFDNFFVWLRTGEYVFFHNKELFRTRFYSGEFALNGGKGKEKLSKWKDNFLKKIRI